MSTFTSFVESCLALISDGIGISAMGEQQPNTVGSAVECGQHQWRRTVRGSKIGWSALSKKILQQFSVRAANSAKQNVLQLARASRDTRTERASQET